MVLSDERLNEYAQRLEDGERGCNPVLAALLNVEVEDLVTEIRNLRAGIRRLRKRYHEGNDPYLRVSFELEKLLEGRFE